MKPSFLPLHSFVTAAAFAAFTASVLAQAPAPVAPGTAPATTTGAPATPAPKPLGSSEKNFIKNTSKSLSYLTALAASAQAAYTDPKDNKGKLRADVDKNSKKAFAALSTFATSRGETVSTDLDMSDKSEVERLGKLKDDHFTKRWLESLSKEAKKLDHDVDMASKTLQDPDLKMFVINYGPMLHDIFTASEKEDKGFKPKK